MVYSTDAAKWKAYEFSDPFAAGSFFVCNKINKFFCRPDCDARPITNLKSEIKFVEHPTQAIQLGYTPCESCDPVSSPCIDVQLLIKCVAHINQQIGFMPPLLDVNEDRNNQRIKANIIESKRANEEQILNTINNAAPGSSRRLSLPVINMDGKFSKDTTSLSKNDSDHYRLVDLACRHLALAAAMSIYQTSSSKNPSTPEEGNSPSSPSASKRRRRRGGVLGFKELAAKSKLSAWHFHRVFKSVTGLTPKTYGDKCWEFIKKHKESGKHSLFSSSPEDRSSTVATAGVKTPSLGYQTPASSTHSMSESVPTSPEFALPPSKRVKIESPDQVSPGSKANGFNVVNQYDNLGAQLNQPLDFNDVLTPALDETKNQYPIPQQATFEFNQPLFNNNFNMFESQMSNNNYTRAFSVPDLTKFNREYPSTLFGHTQKLEEAQDKAVKQETTSPLLSNISPSVEEAILGNIDVNLNSTPDMVNNFQPNQVDDFTNMMAELDTNMPMPADDYNNFGLQNLSPVLGINQGIEMNNFNAGYGAGLRNDNGLAEMLSTTVTEL
ncbi:uncharacterized protein CANTADRAFT_23930 [Suhomyces tanzawaensis NRRL Y-17324]|uniref:Ada DNA repair metal-binding domain-containing protein n=1 Tax=Suhomyces tanzawaensis NRRL Y-17324 TaxID=984487 RepID=A0A1E4SC55_9ASCO|nr:uncharacterized protein CANTADRAFT_23930 [Suhomyces tanzawaensis NRRL Y-17324]ODV77100.1 hypothetical protein CANTADRAFT_23930 [Suhomyces tanzawaensis NRRL Y-17324]